METLPIFGLGEAIVESLKVVSDASLEEDIVGDLFNSRDREIIRRIPLSLHPTDNQWRWLRDPWFEKSAESNTTRLIHLHLEAHRFESDIRYDTHQ